MWLHWVWLARKQPVMTFEIVYVRDKTSLIQGGVVTKCSHLDMEMAYCCSRCPLPGCLQKSIRATDLEEHCALKLQLDQALKASGTDTIH
jgi:hypothetical protein